MSNTPSPQENNKNNTANNGSSGKKSKSPVMRIESAGDIPEEQLKEIARSFAEKNAIANYRLNITINKDLIGGFVIYYLGMRYDYTIRGQLSRINAFMKAHAASGEDEDSGSDDRSFRESVTNTLMEALHQFPESSAASLDSAELWGLDDEQFKSRLEAAFNSLTTLDEVGSVVSVSDGVATVSGLEHCMLDELVMFNSGAMGIAMNLERRNVGVVILTDEDTVVEGMLCKRTSRTFSVPVGYSLLGRVVDPLGRAIDGGGNIRYTEMRPVESPAPTIVQRSPVNRPLATGITAIDALTPIGRGQRELIIGDRQTGKTSIAIDTIINQADEDVICVYVAIGQKMSNIVSTVNLLEKHGAMSYTVVVAASASQSAAMQYIAPFSGCAIAEKFMYDYNKDVLIIYDDLSKHAQAYRAISLLLRRPPGREAYPGDVFYLHSRLLERSAKLSDAMGGGSITALPIVETLGDDISAYIPTNVISITDGQIYLAPELFFSGQRPAINVGLSVSRVGGAAQTKATKKVGGPLRITLAQAREMASFAQFGSELDENTQMQLKRGIILNEVLKQDRFATWSMAEQVVILYIATTDKLTFLAQEDIAEFYKGFISSIEVTHPDIFDRITGTKKFEDDVKASIDEVFEEYKDTYIAEHMEYLEEE
ncbi:F-type H+-transporting ATPase subunit alpha [Ruminococcaceae bacterium YRB3002]|nr:F-type H+-transporting ATPase subunit alpha [Ruminococcaceae bacterium YRB3002]